MSFNKQQYAPLKSVVDVQEASALLKRFNDLNTRQESTEESFVSTMKIHKRFGYPYEIKVNTNFETIREPKARKVKQKRKQKKRKQKTLMELEQERTQIFENIERILEKGIEGKKEKAIVAFKPMRVSKEPIPPKVIEWEEDCKEKETSEKGDATFTLDLNSKRSNDSAFSSIEEEHVLTFFNRLDLVTTYKVSLSNLPWLCTLASPPQFDPGKFFLSVKLQ